MFRSVVCAFAFALSALPALAQTEEDRPLARFRLEQLQQVVGLTEDQAHTVVERWARYDRDQFEKSRQIKHLRRQFNDILLGPGTEEEKSAKVRPLLDQFIEHRRQQADLKFRFEEDIRARLSPAQQVRLIVQVDELQRRMLEALKEGMGHRPGLEMRPNGRLRRSPR